MLTALLACSVLGGCGGADLVFGSGGGTDGSAASELVAEKSVAGEALSDGIVVGGISATQAGSGGSVASGSVAGRDTTSRTDGIGTTGAGARAEAGSGASAGTGAAAGATSSSAPSARPTETPVVAGSCPAATAPGRIAQTLVTPAAPVAVPAAFMGIHRGLNQPTWVSSSNAAIPAPSYAYGYVRTLKVDVDGAEERGFWSNIEIAPGRYDWSAMDKWMQANAGHPVIWMVYGTPSFYQKYPGEPSRWPSWPGIASPPTEDAGHAALKAYVQAARARYGSQIAAFEVWNEPTLPWTGSSTSHDDRWTPQWGQANLPGNPAPFFSGSASDLANIAYTMDRAGLGVPVLGAAFVDQSEGGQHTVTRFLEAPVTLPGASGRGKDYIQGLSIHFYDYGFSPAAIVPVIDGYRSKLAAAGLRDLPIWGTETGAEGSAIFGANDRRAPTNVQRWVYLAAARGLQSMVLYGHVSGTDAERFLGDPIRNPEVAAALDRASRINGSVICDAAILDDGRVWITTRAGDDFAI